MLNRTITIKYSLRMTPQLEKVFFKYIRENKKYYEVVQPHFFKNSEINMVYKILREYILANSEATDPSPKQLWEMVNLEDKEGVMTRELFKAVLQVDLNEYDAKNFILPRFNTWVLSNRVKAGTVDIIDEVRGIDDISDIEKTQITVEKIKDIVGDMTSTRFIDDDEDMGSDFDEPESHYQDNSTSKVRSGFPTIDHILGGGWDVKSLNILMAETSQGKCFVYTNVVYTNVAENDTGTIPIGELFDLYQAKFVEK